MNKEDRAKLVGMVLGDGYINVRTRKQSGKYLYESSELTIVHSLKQGEYLKYKADVVRRIFGGNFSITKKTAKLKTTGKQYHLLGFSKSNPYFRILRRIMYPYGKKHISFRVLDMLSPEGIAFWYMDDGHARRNINKEGYVSSVATEISTCCSLQEAKDACTWFEATYGIEWKPFPTRAYYSLRCNTANSHTFIRLILPYIPSFMSYKVAHVADLNLHERMAPVGICVQCGDILYDNRRKGLCTTCYTKQYRR